MTNYPAHLTLMEKFKLKAEEIQRGGPYSKSSINCNSIAPKAFYVMLVGIVGWLELLGLPALYPPEEWPGLLLFNRVFLGIVGVQIYVHWYFLMKVKSAYLAHPEETPAKVDVGQEVQEGGKSGKQKDGRFLMYVATGMPDSSGRVPRKAFPYWSWTPCLLCQKLRPPRCHHCPFCQVCILKRDHHCYFTNNCVGAYNLRYYVTYVFWASVGTTFALVHLWPYLFYDIYPHMHTVDFFPPIAFVRAVLGYQRFSVIWLGTIGWTCTSAVLLLLLGLFGAWECVLRAFTTFERSNEIKVADGRTLSERIRAVFGRYWVLNFLFPTHYFFEAEEDPIMWPSVKT